MSIQDQIAADEAALSTAQSALDEAKAKLEADQAQLEAIKPHLSVLAEIEAYAGNLVPEVQAEFAALIAKARSLF